MAYLESEEIITHLHNEIIQEVQQDWAGAIDASIDAAISEAMGYLSQYDKSAILAQTGAAREPILLLYIKDITIWHFIQLANPNIEMELREKRYERAIQWLRDVQKGIIVPNLPLPVATTENPYPGKVKFGSNPKRNTQY